MTPEDLIQETKETLQFNTKKVEIIDKDIQQIKQETEQKIVKLQQDRNLIIGQIIKDQGGIEKLEKLINSKNKVES
jgi:hypothetical protein|tara:strand:+ start:452 stop:679 length:228 start_codon:yes stop_codon:yes gene_type:complete